MQNHQGLSHNSWLAFAMNYGVPAALVLICTLMIRLGMFKQRAALILLPACMVSMTVEGWLTAPLSALSPDDVFGRGMVREPSVGDRTLTSRLARVLANHSRCDSKVCGRIHQDEGTCGAVVLVAVRQEGEAVLIFTRAMSLTPMVTSSSTRCSVLMSMR